MPFTQATHGRLHTQYGRGRKGSLYMTYSGFNLLIYCGRNKDSADTMYLQSRLSSFQSASSGLGAQGSLGTEGQALHGELM